MRLHVLPVALAAIGTICVTYAQQPPRTVRTVGITPIGPLVPISNPEYTFAEVYFLSNGGANALAVVTTAGAVLIDAKLPGWGPATLEALEQVTDMPVTTIINTHAHEDHAGANSEYPGPVEIVVHENSSRRLVRSAAKGKTVKTFGDHTSVTVGTRTLHVYHFGRGHTDGDAIVVIPDTKLAYVGDLFAEKAVPVVDPGSGGSALALPQTLARAITEITGVEWVVTGHGPPPEGRRRDWRTWKDFQEYAEFTRDFVAAVTAAWKNGRTVDQAVSKLTLQEKYKGYRMDGAKATIETIFTELKRSSAAKR